MPSSGGGGTSTSIQKTELPDEVKPYLGGLLEGVAGQPDGNPLTGSGIAGQPLSYSGPTSVPISGDTINAQGMLRNAALSGGQIGAAAGREITGTLGGQYLPGGVQDFMNPNAGGDPNAYAGGLLDSIARDVNPAVEGQFGLRGRTSGAGMEEAKARGIAQAYAPYAYQASEAERGRQFQAGSEAQQLGLTAQLGERENQQRSLALAPGIDALGYTPGQQLSGVGANVENYIREQQNIDAAQREFDQMEPWQRASMVSQYIYGFPGQSSIGTQQLPGRSPIMGGLGGAASGALIGSLVPGVGTAVGAGVGGLLGLFG